MPRQAATAVAAVSSTSRHGRRADCAGLPQSHLRAARCLPRYAARRGASRAGRLVAYDGHSVVGRARLQTNRCVRGRRGPSTGAPSPMNRGRRWPAAAPAATRGRGTSSSRRCSSLPTRSPPRRPSRPYRRPPSPAPRLPPCRSCPRPPAGRRSRGLSVDSAAPLRAPTAAQRWPWRTRCSSIPRSTCTCRRRWCCATCCR